MKCLHPRTKRVDSSPWTPPYSIVVPCGKCPICVKRYQDQWKVRLFWEFKDHSCACFLTLTYRNDSIPTVVDVATGDCHYSLNKRHVQLWLKRLRHTVKKPFKYFICGEYGPVTKRPHMHCIFYGLNKYDILDAIKDWSQSYGFVDSKDINISTSKSLANSARYVSKYVNKGAFSNPFIKEFNLQPEFHLMSKGIGLYYVEINKRFHLHENLSGQNRFDSIVRNNITYVGNAVYPLPRYYRDKIYPPKTLLRYKVQMATQKALDDDYIAKLAVLSTQMPENEAVSRLALQEISDAECTANEIILRQSKQYSKSKL